MPQSQLRRDVERRLAHFGCVLASDQIDRLVVYLELLARWNRTVNLTSLPVNPPTDEALARLIVEPVLAARYVLAGDRRMLDVGSGGGSPALPFQIASRIPELVMIEARERKSAFLREAVRQLGMTAIVLTGRTESFVKQPIDHKSFHLITLRAVDVTHELATWALSAAGPRGRLFWFHSMAKYPNIFQQTRWELDTEVTLTEDANRLTVMRVPAQEPGEAVGS